MSDKEILERAIQKAIDGGWKSPLIGRFVGIKTDLISGEWFTSWEYEDGGPNYGYSAIFTIFNHDFAKALWGDKETLETFGHKPGNSVYATITVPKYKWHLMNMIIADAPIKYLGDNL